MFKKLESPQIIPEEKAKQCAGSNCVLLFRADGVPSTCGVVIYKNILPTTTQAEAVEAQRGRFPDDCHRFGKKVDESQSPIS